MREETIVVAARARAGSIATRARTPRRASPDRRAARAGRRGRWRLAGRAGELRVARRHPLRSSCRRSPGPRCTDSSSAGSPASVERVDARVDDPRHGAAPPRVQQRDGAGRMRDEHRHAVGDRDGQRGARARPTDDRRRRRARSQPVPSGADASRTVAPCTCVAVARRDAAGARARAAAPTQRAITRRTGSSVCSAEAARLRASS